MGSSTKAPLSERVVTLGQLAGEDLRLLGMAPLPDEPVLLEAPAGRWDLVLMRLADDPQYVAGQLGIPARQQAFLRSLDKRGVVFDELLIAHEVPRGAVKAPLTKSSGRDVVARQSTRHVVDLQATVGRILTVGKLAAIGTLALAAVPLAVLSLDSDPILIGALTQGGSLQPGTPAVYFEVIRWK